MIKLKTGDPCPCCGQPILTDDPSLLELLSWMKAAGRILPGKCESKGEMCVYVP